LWVLVLVTVPEMLPVPASAARADDMPATVKITARLVARDNSRMNTGERKLNE
jgi:hypothetical protein